MNSSSHPGGNEDNLRLSRIPPQEGGTSLATPDVMNPQEVSALPGSTHAPKNKKRYSDTPKAYYNIPMLKPSKWTWMIPVYFFLGGLSAGAYILARMASRFGGKRYKDIEQTATAVAAAAFVPAAPLLIADLGDPKRFHYMLRIFKPRSPMNLGSWVLTGYGAMVTLASLNEWRKVRNSPPAPLETQRHRGKREEGEKRRRGTIHNPQSTIPNGNTLNSQPSTLNSVIDAILDGMGVPLALLLSGYTGVLLSTTATPIWARNRWLGPLFTTSAVGAGVAAVELALEARSSEAEHKPSHAALKQIDSAAKIAEAVTLAGFLGEAGKLAAPVVNGKYAPHLWGGAVGAGLIGSTVLGAIPVKKPKTRRALRIVGAVAGVAGGFALKWAIDQAGHISGNDPQAARDVSQGNR